MTMPVSSTTPGTAASQRMLSQELLTALPRMPAALPGLFVGLTVAAGGFTATYCGLLPREWTTRPAGLHSVAWLGHGLAAALAVMIGQSYRGLAQFKTAQVASADDDASLGAKLAAIWNPPDAPTTRSERSHALRQAAENWQQQCHHYWWTIAILLLGVPLIVWMEGCRQYFANAAGIRTFGHYFAGLVLGSCEFLPLWWLARNAHLGWRETVAEMVTPLVESLEPKPEEPLLYPAAPEQTNATATRSPEPKQNEPVEVTPVCMDKSKVAEQDSTEPPPVATTPTSNYSAQLGEID